jgi:hypothetical protein
VPAVAGAPTEEDDMPRISQATTSEHIELDGVEGHYGELDAYTVGFEIYHRDEDLSPLFVCLPDDRCQARHWGVVLEGSLVFRYADGTEDVIGAGEAYYAPPGHLPLMRADTRVIEFTPSEELAQTMAVVERNLAAMQAG